MNWLAKKILEFTGSQKFLSAQLDITAACNLDCIHCYQPYHASEKDLSLSDWRSILDQYGLLIEKLYLRPKFCISGGEPTISPIFSAILAELHSRWPGADVTVLTNGTRLSSQLVSDLAKHKADVQISLDGPDRERHDAVRGPGVFERALAGFELLRGAGLRVIFQAVLSDRTAPWIESFFALAGQKNAAAMNFTRFVPQGRGKALSENGGDRPLLGKDLKVAYAAIVEASAKSGVPTVTNQPLFALLSPELGAHGKFGFQGLIIDHSGNLKVTSRADFILGNVFEAGLEKLFLDHQVMKDLRNGKIDGCGTCKIYDRCGGDRNASFAAYGSFFKKDPGCWL
ncbi:MAG: radical SAM protein [Elusimicrobiales bacterium]|nr:radical SAM protein [Elusimicrobiales bacterium]